MPTCILCEKKAGMRRIILFVTPASYKVEDLGQITDTDEREIVKKYREAGWHEIENGYSPDAEMNIIIMSRRERE